MRAALIILLALTACDGPSSGDQAQKLFSQYGCAACHAIPGVRAPSGVTGPPLDALAEQAYVAGVMPNTEQSVAAFIVDPQAVDPRSAMPKLGVSAEEARIMARYLHDVEGGR